MTLATANTVSSGAINGAGRDVQRFVLWPHRSLNRRGLFCLLTGTGVGMIIMLALGLGSDLLHAWPVLLCAAIAVAGFGAALWCNQRSARMSEVVEITQDCVRVSRLGPAAKQFEATFNPAWVRVNVETDRIVSNRIILRESGRSLSIGSFLTPEERLELAASLRSSLRSAGG